MPITITWQICCEIHCIYFVFQQIRSKIQLNQPNLPNNVKMAYRALCPDAGGTWAENSLECDNVPIGSEVTYLIPVKSV